MDALAKNGRFSKRSLGTSRYLCQVSAGGNGSVDEIMGMNEDIRLISDYCGISDRETQRAKDYAFGSGVSQHEFWPSIDMAKAWLRMARGQGTAIDRVFLQHEILDQI